MTAAYSGSHRASRQRAARAGPRGCHRGTGWHHSPAIPDQGRPLRATPATLYVSASRKRIRMRTRLADDADEFRVDLGSGGV